MNEIYTRSPRTRSESTIQSQVVSVGPADTVLFVDKKMSVDSNSTLDLLTIAEVAELFKISKSTVRRLQQQRRIQFTKIGGSVRFAKNDLVSYVERERVESIG